MQFMTLDRSLVLPFIWRHMTPFDARDGVKSWCLLRWFFVGRLQYGTDHSWSCPFSKWSSVARGCSRSQCAGASVYRFVTWLLNLLLGRKPPLRCFDPFFQ
jgi:hypothetical protein